LLTHHGSGLRKRIFKVPRSQHYEQSLVSFQLAWGSIERKKERARKRELCRCSPDRVPSSQEYGFGIHAERRAALAYHIVYGMGGR
jgi:hypothetical protein